MLLSAKINAVKVDELFIFLKSFIAKGINEKSTIELKKMQSQEDFVKFGFNVVMYVLTKRFICRI